MKPFIVLALSKTGTTMLVNALNSHPQIEDVVHEFRGDEEKFIEHPQVLSNYFHDWMKGVPLIHIYREDAIAGARSMLLMSYTFPDGVVTLPKKEVLILARQRQGWDSEFEAVADFSVSYEMLCNGGEIKQLPTWFVEDFCRLVGLKKHPMTTEIRKSRHLLLRNQEEISCLRV